MATYSYTAVDKAGKKTKGSIEAESLEKARSIIKGDGLMPTELREASMMDKEISLGGVFKKKVTIRDLSECGRARPACPRRPLTWP